jgi:hypothetical protein
MAVTALSTLVAVSTDAGPGDALYGLKRGTEQTQLALAGDARGQTLLEFARTRLQELEELTDADPGLVLETLATMDAQTTEGAAWLTDRAVDTGADAPLDQLTGWSAGQTAGLTALRAALPGSTVDELDRSLGLLADIDARALGLEEVLGCPAGPPIESTDALGPVPGLCLDEQVPPPVAGGEEVPGSVPVPGSGAQSGGATTTTAPGAPGGATGGEQPGTSGEGSGGPLPTAEVPSGGLPSVPVPTIPLPSVSVSVPGSTPSAGTSSSSGSTPGAPLDLNICLGPIAVGSCP